MQKLIAKNRSTAAAFESLHIVRKDGSRTEFRWDMVGGIASLADEEPDLDVPIGPMAVFDWIEKHVRESVAKWAADGVVAATTATDAFDLSAWSPGVDSEPNPFKPADKSYARIRSLVPARCQIVDASGTGAEETLELMPQRPEFDSDPDGNRPNSASYGTRVGTPSRRAPAGAADAADAAEAAKARATFVHRSFGMSPSACLLALFASFRSRLPLGLVAPASSWLVREGAAII